MAETAQALESRTTDLTKQAFDCFSDDISTMFDTGVEAKLMDFNDGTVSVLKDKYKKLVAVCSVATEGVLNGNFHIVFDKEGLFTMAGTFVMQPEKVIIENRKGGTESEANEIADAMGEVGNLLVGSWDRIFREEMEGHGHFVQNGSFVGNPWSKPKESIGLDPEQECVLLDYQMTVEPLEAFECTLVYPKSIFDGSAPPPAAEKEESKQEDPPAEESAAPEAEQAQPEEAPTEAAEETPEAESSDAEPDPNQDAEVEQQVASEQPQPEPQASQPVSEAIQTITTTGNLPAMSGNSDIVLSGVTAQQIMRPEPAWAEPENTVEQLIAKMQQADTSYLLIGNEGKIEGIVSKSDVRGAMSPYLQSMFVKWRGPMDVATLQIKAKWVMSRPVRTVRPDTPVTAIMKAMSDHGGRCMPVVDQSGKAVGTITVFDVFRTLLHGTGGTTAGNTNQLPPLA